MGKIRFKEIQCFRENNFSAAFSCSSGITLRYDPDPNFVPVTDDTKCRNHLMISNKMSHPGRRILLSTSSCVLQQTYAVNSVQSGLYHNFPLRRLFPVFQELQWNLYLNAEANGLNNSASHLQDIPNGLYVPLTVKYGPLLP